LLTRHSKYSAMFQNTVPCCQKHTPTDCFVGDFAHWLGVRFRGKVTFEETEIANKQKSLIRMTSNCQSIFQI